MSSTHDHRRSVSSFPPSFDELQSLASIDRPPSVDEGLPPSKIYHPFSIHVLALLVPGSILGVLARLGLQALTTYDGPPIFPLAYVQAIGCLIMGYGLSLKEPIGQFYGPLYTALTTGFCGSLTTFSGWQIDVFESWINASQYHRGRLQDVIDGISKVVFTLVLSLTSLSFGAHLSAFLFPRFLTPSYPSRTLCYSLSALAALTYAATFPAYFRLPAHYRHKATAALLFAYPGTLTRYVLSIWLNPLSTTFPVGTFAANMLGTALRGLFHVLQSTRSPVSPNVCVLLQGLDDGYCGCLTTVSTFAAEVATLKGWKGWLYAAISLATGQLLLLAILGPSYWTGQAREQLTCTFA